MPAWIALIDPISHLLDKLIPDPDARARAQEELRKADREEDLEALKLAITSDQAQAASDQQEAGNASLFVCGWRPFIGWVCGVAFAYHFILQPLLAFTLMSVHRPVSLPAFDMQTLTTVLMGMLGLGSLRTLEKLRGVQ